MKVVPGLLLILFTFCTAATGQDKKDGIKWNMDYLDKSWGLKLKSAKVNTMGCPILLLEFSKDLESDELKKLRHTPLWFYCFDEDNVVIFKTTVSALEGEVTGKKGDAFKVELDSLDSHLSKTKKIEVRPNEKK